MINPFCRWEGKKKLYKTQSVFFSTNSNPISSLPFALLFFSATTMPSLGSLFTKGKKPDTLPAVKPLREQFPTVASIETKTRIAFLATAMIDALGSPFQVEQRDELRVIEEMRPHPTTNRPAGTWTDDTSMMLCVSYALANAEDVENSQADQIRALREWKVRGTLSCTGACFDIKGQVKHAIALFSQHDDNADHALYLVRNGLSSDTPDTCGSASLTRALPVGIAFWREPDQAVLQARLSSEITHPSPMCTEATSLFAHIIAVILDRMYPDPRRSADDAESRKLDKLSLIVEVANYPLLSNRLRQVLTLPFSLPPRPEDKAELESWFFLHHPLLQLITSTQISSTSRTFPYTIPPVSVLPTTEHAHDATIAALYCFFTTKNFEEGALMAVNLCGESSTVGAIYASLAGIWYGGEEGKDDKLFWTRRFVNGRKYCKGRIWWRSYQRKWPK